MSHHHYDPALQAELNHRRATLQQDAEQHQLARLAGRAARAAATGIIRPAQQSRDRTSHEIPDPARA